MRARHACQCGGSGNQPQRYDTQRACIGASAHGHRRGELQKRARMGMRQAKTPSEGEHTIINSIFVWQTRSPSRGHVKLVELFTAIAIGVGIAIVFILSRLNQPISQGSVGHLLYNRCECTVDGGGGGNDHNGVHW